MKSEPSMKSKSDTVFIALALGTLLAASMAQGASHHTQEHQDDQADAVCEGFGPQTPRDIDKTAGDNRRVFDLAPSYKEMNLCNLHFHSHAEHKAKAFSIYAGEGDGGHGGGYQCNISKSLSAAELAPPKETACMGLSSGDTIEVHWVYSSCDVTPGKGLESCLSDDCSKPFFRVETQVFTVVNGSSALNFNNLAYQDNLADGFHQAKALPTDTGTPVEFLGSTTGPSFTEQVCSPTEVTWSVRPECTKVDIHSLGEWCKGNVFEEVEAHGVRKLVTTLSLLSEIK